MIGVESGHQWDELMAIQRKATGDDFGLLGDEQWPHAARVGKDCEGRQLPQAVLIERFGAG